MFNFTEEEVNILHGLLEDLTSGNAVLYYPDDDAYVKPSQKGRVLMGITLVETYSDLDRNKHFNHYEYWEDFNG